MGKLEAKTIVKEKRLHISTIKRNKYRSGVIESSVKICPECGDEYCSANFCKDVLYDSFVRIIVTSQQSKVKVSTNTEAIIANLDGKKGHKKKPNIIKSKVVTPKKKVRLLRNKGKKSMSNDLEWKNNKTNNKNDAKPTKPFKRKCSKYFKKEIRKQL